MHIQNLIQFHKFVHKILSGNEILLITKGRNCVVNLGKWTHNKYLVKVNAYAKFKLRVKWKSRKSSFRTISQSTLRDNRPPVLSVFWFATGNRLASPKSCGRRVSLDVLTLSTLGKIFSRRHIEIFFLIFPENRINISCKLFPETICMKRQILFSGKTEKNITNLSPAELAKSAKRYCLKRALGRNNLPWSSILKPTNILASYLSGSSFPLNFTIPVWLIGFKTETKIWNSDIVLNIWDIFMNIIFITQSTIYSSMK